MGITPALSRLLLARKAKTRSQRLVTLGEEHVAITRSVFKTCCRIIWFKWHEANYLSEGGTLLQATQSNRTVLSCSSFAAVTVSAIECLVSWVVQAGVRIKLGWILHDLLPPFHAVTFDNDMSLHRFKLVRAIVSKLLQTSVVVVRSFYNARLYPTTLRKSWTWTRWALLLRCYCPKQFDVCTYMFI